MTKKILFSVGEISSDRHASRLISKMKEDFDREHPNEKLYIGGMGGQRMKKAGADIVFDVTHASSVGITEYYDFHNELKHTQDKFIEMILNNPPDAMVFMDMEGFNMTLGAKLKKAKVHTKLIYYITPQRWVLRVIGKHFCNKINKVFDIVINGFENEYEFYKNIGIESEFYGNPIANSIQVSKTPDQIKSEINHNKNKKLIAILPGSRKQEINNLCEIFFKSATIINKKIESNFIIPIAHNDLYEDINLISRKYSDINILLTKDESHDIINASDFVITSSGSATLEIAIINKPMIIGYKISNLTYALGKMLYRNKFIGLPNIIMNKEVVPEILQGNLNPQNISSKALEILTNEKIKKRIKKEFDDLRKKTLVKDPLESKISELILSIVC